MDYELAKKAMKRYKQQCKTCNSYYEGYGRFYCSSACQPREKTGGAVNPISGERHYNWKGKAASYFAKHIYLKTHFGKASKCENPNCIYPRKNAARSWVRFAKRFDWALKRGHDYSHDREDYLMLCPSCHKKYDLCLITI